MENSMINLAKVNVLRCDPRMIKNPLNPNGPEIQELDKEENALFNVHHLTQVWDDEFSVMKTDIVKTKSIVELPEGESIAKMQVFTMGETKGNFTAVNKYYKILSVVPEKAIASELFVSKEKAMSPAIKKKSATTSTTAAVQ